MARTHHLTIGPETVRKRYTSWSRGEPDREWAALQILSQQAEGLAPLPLAREEEDGRPVVVMSRLPGEPPTDVTETAQVTALATALRRLYSVEVPASLGERTSGPSTMYAEVALQLLRPGDLDLCQDAALVSRALRRARHWVNDEEPGLITDRVLGQADGNLANRLWDGEIIRLVDFEDSGASDLTYELADVLEHASSRLQRRLDTDALVEAMGLGPGQLARLDHHRRLLACFWLGMLLPGGRGFHRNPPGSTEDQAAHVLELLE